MKRVNCLTTQAECDVFILSKPFRAALFFALLLITFLATTSREVQLASVENIDKFQHLLAFLCLAFLADFAFARHAWNRYKFFSLLAYGLVLEIIQHYLPHRHFSLWDLGADTLGLLIYPLFLPLLKQVSWLRPRWSI